MRRLSLTAQAVEAAVDTLLREAGDGPRATVSALARHLQVNRQTLYRDFPGQITRLQTQQPPDSAAPSRARDITTDRATIARLRRDKEGLTRHLHIYEDHIRRLTTENASLRAALEAHTDVAIIRLTARQTEV
ncbi:hypothetical protein ACFV2U_48840 [Streptomyces sp. NPDC059697]|uniref:hypothetical protein n=1 Tax=Streptomyces sp. NPDC059697 TaxID=3346912 RepID=UPI0036B47F58